MNHLHSPAPYKALKLEMTHACFAYDKDLFTPSLRPWENEFFHNWFIPKNRSGRSYTLRSVSVLKIFNLK